VRGGERPALGRAPASPDPSLCPERAHPRAGFLDEPSRAHDTHSLTRSKVFDVVRDEEPCSRADRCSEDRDVLRVGELPRALTIVRCRALDLDRDGTEELLE